MQETTSADSLVEAKKIAAAHARILEVITESTADVAPYLEAIELMEGTLPSDSCDERIKLAVDIAEGLGLADRPELCMRAFRAAFPTGARVVDPRLERRWHSNIGGIELHVGNVASAVKHLALAYEMATRQKDHLGLTNTWIPLSALANGAGQYEDAVCYSELALKHFELAGGDLSGGYYPRLPIAAYFNRGNALFRLGRLEAASCDLTRVTALCGGRNDPWQLAAHVAALCSLAEVWLVRGEVNMSGILLENARSLRADEKGVLTASLNTERVRGQLLVWRGEHSAGLKVLETVLRDATANYSAAAYDGEVMDTLHALDRAYRKVGDPESANRFLALVGQQLRSTAERAFATSANLPFSPLDRGVQSALKGVEVILASRDSNSSTTPSSLNSIASSLQHLVALACSACAVEESSGEHCLRVSRLCRDMARALNCDDETVRISELAGLLHDAGKSGVPTSTLSKRSALSEHEERLLCDHAEYGAQLVERTSMPGRFRVAEAIRLHHHPFVGVDTVCQLSGESIPLEVRILSVCDQFDALIAGRPRQPAVTAEQALLRIFRGAGTDFDPRVVEVFVEIVRRMSRDHGDLLAYLAEEADKYDYTSARRKFRQAVGQTGLAIHSEGVRQV